MFCECFVQNGNGTIEFDEFKRLMDNSPMASKYNERQLLHMFSELTSHDGLLTKYDWINIFHHVQVAVAIHVVPLFRFATPASCSLADAAQDDAHVATACATCTRRTHKSRFSRCDHGSGVFMRPQRHLGHASLADAARACCRAAV